jgi:hypothetical protein
MEGGRLMHELWDFVDSKGYIGVGEWEILKGANKATIGGRIGQSVTREEWEGMGCGHRCLNGFGTGHVALFEKIKDVALLGENEVVWSGGSFHVKEVMERTEVLDCKFGIEGLD